jgi:uncharacterized membrane protein
VTRRSWSWLGIVGVLAVVDGGFTLRSTLTWTPQPGGPTDGTLGQLVGWFTFTVLVVWMALIVVGAVRSARERRQMTRRRGSQADRFEDPLRPRER